MLKNNSEIWNFSRDIDSPSHYIDIEDSREILIDDYGIPEDKAEEFASMLTDMLNLIRNV